METPPDEAPKLPQSEITGHSETPSKTLSEISGQSDEKTEARKKSEADDRQFFAYMKAFIGPTLILKTGVLYFGLNYSSYPDRGYGWGLLICIVLSLVNFGVFIYKNWSDVDEDEGRR